jgi:hypothetical protein
MLLLALAFLAFNWSAGFGAFLQVSALASHWLDDCVIFMPTLEKSTNHS